MPEVRNRVSSLTTKIAPSSAPHEPECWTSGCKAPGPYKTVPDLAQHRWVAHGVLITDTYAESGYRDADERVGVARCGTKMRADYIDKHQGKCAKCLDGAAADRFHQRKEVAMEMATAPCGKKVPGGSALGGHKGKCKACQAKKPQPTMSPPAVIPKPPARRKVRKSAHAAESRRSASAVSTEGIVAHLEARAALYEKRATLLREAATAVRGVA